MSLNLGFTIQQLTKDNRLTHDDVTKAQSWLRFLGCTCITNQQMSQFLLSSENDLEVAKQSITEYFRLRCDYSDLFSNRRLKTEGMRNIISTVQFNIIPRRTKYDNLILIFRLSDSDYRKFDLNPALKLLSMVLDAAIYDYPPKGLIVLFDLQKMSLMHLTAFSARSAVRYIHYLQEALPVNLKSIHVVNVSCTVEKLVNLLKPLMRENLRHLVHIHPKSMHLEEYGEKIAERECLPKDYGGFLDPIDELHCKSLKIIEKLEGFFEAEEAQRAEVKRKLCIL